VVVTLDSVADWIAWFTFVLSLAIIAWAAFRYVKIERAKVDQREFENFYRTLERVHNKDSSLILQRAAIFELRNFPKYKDFIVRLCRDRNSLFPGDAEKIQHELLLTLQHFEGSGS
jgi:hypothetical protein